MQIIHQVLYVASVLSLLQHWYCRFSSLIFMEDVYDFIYLAKPTVKPTSQIVLYQEKHSLPFSNSHVLICTHVTTTHFWIIILKRTGQVEGRRGQQEPLPWAVTWIKSKSSYQDSHAFIILGFPTQDPGLTPLEAFEDFTALGDKPP